MYADVPENGPDLCGTSVPLSGRASPKSARSGSPVRSINTFEGLMSRWTIPASCIASKPAASLRTISIASRGDR